MLQPFQLFKANHVRGLEQLKKIYLVTQSYHRAYDQFAENKKIDILLTGYSEKGAANIHWNGIKTDKYAAIIDLRNEVHKKKLEEMLAEGSGYRLFWAVIKSNKELKERIDSVFRDKIRRYINLKTNWRIGGDKTVEPDIEIAFGELFIKLKYGGYQVIRVKFEEIEKM